MARAPRPPGAGVNTGTPRGASAPPRPTYPGGSLGSAPASISIGVGPSNTTPGPKPNDGGVPRGAPPVDRPPHPGGPPPPIVARSPAAREFGSDMNRGRGTSRPTSGGNSGQGGGGGKPAK